MLDGTRFFSDETLAKYDSVVYNSYIKEIDYEKIIRSDAGF